MPNLFRGFAQQQALAGFSQIDSPAFQMMHDREQRTAVVVQLFDTAEDMSAGEAVFARDGVTVTAFAVNHPPIETLRQ